MPCSVHARARKPPAESHPQLTLDPRLLLAGLGLARLFPLLLPPIHVEQPLRLQHLLHPRVMEGQTPSNSNRHGPRLPGWAARLREGPHIVRAPRACHVKGAHHDILEGGEGEAVREVDAVNEHLPVAGDEPGLTFRGFSVGVFVGVCMVHNSARCVTEHPEDGAERESKEEEEGCSSRSRTQTPTHLEATV
jgi:hypothetical protein